MVLVLVISSLSIQLSTANEGERNANFPSISVYFDSYRYFKCGRLKFNQSFEFLLALGSSPGENSIGLIEAIDVFDIWM